MARPIASLLALSLGLATAVGMASCGEEDAQLLPGETAREITANLDSVQQLADEEDCAGAESAARQVGEQVEALEGVDARLKRALREGAARLNEVVAGCEEATTESTETTVPEEEEEEGASRNRGGRKGQREGGGRERGGAGREGGETERETAPPTAPEANGRAPEGGGEAEGGGEGETESPSGGLSPATPAGEGE